MKEVNSPILIIKDYFMPIYILIRDLLLNSKFMNNLDIKEMIKIYYPTILFIIEILNLIFNPSILYRIFILFNIGLLLFSCYVKINDMNLILLKNITMVILFFGISIIFSGYIKILDIVFLFYLINRTIKTVYNFGL